MMMNVTDLSEANAPSKVPQEKFVLGHIALSTGRSLNPKALYENFG
jgi:hypothetical protein